MLSYHLRFINRLATAESNGMVLLPDRNGLYVAEANSTVRVIDLKHQKKKKLAMISNGGRIPTEQLAYSSRSNLVLVTNPLESPENSSFVSVINTTSWRVDFPHAFSTLQQLAWDSATEKFYVSYVLPRRIPAARSMRSIH
jgi:hypothetical protein